jgi:hypothetical protein
MRLLAFCGLILIFLNVTVCGQESVDQTEAICKEVVCREPTTVKLKLNSKEYAQFDFPMSPFVAEGFINILSGEKFSVEFEEKGGDLENPRFVKDVTHPERTISIAFSQSEEGMVLTIQNPFPKPIVYECRIQHYKHEGLSKTSVVPVRAKLVSFELWPYPIAQVVISNVRFQK